MENKGLLFIPDISGFTRFVNDVEIEHSRFIIQQLLEELIRANDTHLDISEIEGDAILFYKFGEPEGLGALYKQVERMFRAFHQYLIAYDNRKICQCKACISAVDLSLKVITHYGEFTPLKVRQFNKLIGKDVIVAHQLLKNDIRQHEYWLITKALNRQPAELTNWMQWTASSKETDSGEINFYYTLLSPLKKEIPKPYIRPELSKKIKMLSVSKEYNIDVKTLCYTVVHFEFRHLWYVGIKAIDEVEHFLPGVGSRHRHVLTNGKIGMMYISSFVYDPEGKTIFSETNEKDKSAICFVAEKTGSHTSRLTLEFYLQPNILKQVLFNQLEKNKKKQDLEVSLERLDKVLNEMVVPLEF
ncbi:MAG TPA: DUF2652 domain-containing protein [Chitinophagaceae bacterium]|nr:DUF2652 domain-containing protein [Chitinophagaceae bacterium]